MSRLIRESDVQDMLDDAQCISDGEFSYVCTEDIKLSKLPTVEAVPLSWWNEMKDFLKSWKDDPWEKSTTSANAELVLNKMNFIEEKGTDNGNSTL